MNISTQRYSSFITHHGAIVNVSDARDTVTRAEKFTIAP